MDKKNDSEKEEVVVDTPVESEEPSPAPSVSDMLEKAEKAAERLEKANAQLDSLLEKQKALKLEATMGGATHAGSPTISKEERAKANARKFLEGTGFEDVVQ
jgi:hypothetical protein